MRCIGHELALHPKSRAQPGQKIVERSGKSPQLVARINNGKALVQILRANTESLFRHGQNRRETLTREKPAAESGQQQSQRYRYRQDQPVGLQLAQ